MGLLLPLACSVIVALTMAPVPAAGCPEETLVDPPSLTTTDGQDEPPAGSAALYASSAQALGGQET